ncbi:MAG: hypothetical protein ABIJ12_00715 [bacterium]
MKRVGSSALLILLGLILAAIGIGCSGDNPENMIGSQTANAVFDNENGDLALVLTADQIQFNSRVASVDTEESKLTFTTIDYVAYAADDCEITLVVNGVMTPITFDEILVDDSIRVCGVLQDEVTIIANNIRIFRGGDCPDYDVVFFDTIMTIDYSAGTFTVSGRTETISINESTIIWGHAPLSTPTFSSGEGEGDVGGNSDNDWVKKQVEIYEFTDLAVGFVVEVHAVTIDSDNLLAVNIKVADCTFKKCEEFSAYLATIDAVEGIVTFDGLAWIGAVCPKALLTDVDGTALLLSDFYPGDYVKVKGFPLEGNDFFICAMQKI